MHCIDLKRFANARRRIFLFLLLHAVTSQYEDDTMAPGERPVDLPLQPNTDIQGGALPDRRTAAQVMAAEAPLPQLERLLAPTTQFDCSGWSTPTSKRIYLESQAWWTNPDEDVPSQSMHIHMGLCFPHAKLGMISGIVTFDVLVQLHNLPVRFNTARQEIMYPVGVVVDASINGVTEPYIGGRPFRNWTCINPRTYAANGTLDTYYDDCKGVSRFTLDTSDPRIGTGRMPIYINARRAVVTDTRFGVNLQALIHVAPGSNPGPDRSNDWSMEQAQFGPRNLVFARLEPCQFPWCYNVVGLYDGFIRYSSPAEPLRANTFSRRMRGVAWQHGNRAEETGTFISINPSFHARNLATGAAAPILGAVRPNALGQCVSFNESAVLKRYPFPKTGPWANSRRSHCPIRFRWRMVPGWNRMFVRGDSFMPANRPNVLEAIRQASNTGDLRFTGNVPVNRVLNGGTQSTVLVAAFFAA